MRQTTVETMRATDFAGSVDSAAAIVTISAPIIEKNTVTEPANTATTPKGANPPYCVRLPKVGPVGEAKPKAKAPQIAMNRTIATTLMEANQNSNSPKERADIRFTPAIAAISSEPSCHSGSGIQRCSSVAPAMASTGMTMIQKYQYSQPTVKPAQSPSPARANSVKE